MRKISPEEYEESLIRSLEILWGMEARLNNYKPLVTSRLIRPEGFYVIESRPLFIKANTNTFVYLVKRCCADTRKVGQILKEKLKASQYMFSGLKDSNAIVYQYYSFTDVKNPIDKIEVDRPKITAWLISKGFSLKTKSHGTNTFRLKVRTSSPRDLCKEIKKLKLIPGYFGPQRFGIERPNTHLQGFYIIKYDLGSLANEFKSRYPLEKRKKLGYYEHKALLSVKKFHNIKILLKSLDPWLRKFFLEALQAYIFNRTLSKVILNETLNERAETKITIRCLNKKFKVPAARLPAPHMSLRSPWSKLLKKVIEEEGMNEIITNKNIDLRPSLRPLLYPVCVLNCDISSKDIVDFTFVLPAGAYATIALWQVSKINWLSNFE